MNEQDAKELFDKYKQGFLNDQIWQTKMAVSMSGSYKVCWICGTTSELNSILIETDDNRKFGGLQCSDYINIQKSKYNVNYLEINEK